MTDKPKTPVAGEDKATEGKERMELDAMGRAANSLPKPKGRLSPVAREVVELMAREGLSTEMAVERVGANMNAMKKALARPPAKRYYNQIVANIRSGAPIQAYNRIVHMAMTASSEAVRMDANKWIAGVDGLSPLKRIEGKHSINHTFTGFEFDPNAAPIDVTPDNSSSDDDT